MVEPDILAQRAQYSQNRLNELRDKINEKSAGLALDDLAIFCAGSYARLEASQFSDIDIFFVYGQTDGNFKKSKIEEIRLFSALVEIAEEMQFPQFSNDGQYLDTRTCSEVLKHLGSPLDDSLNLFTIRMLMLLESKCLRGEEIFAAVQREIISSYYRDYPDHEATFEPWFLINDIGRFWKTLLLNYEHKRNQPAENELQKNKQKVRNFKLKYSRMTTCFATIAAIASLPKPPAEDQIYELIQQTPQQRLETIAIGIPQTRSSVQRVLSEYSWFLEQTAQTEEELRSGFEQESSRAERFARADDYGNSMFDLIATIGEVIDLPAGKRLIRYLVI